MIKRRQNGDARRTRKVNRPMRMQEIQWEFAQQCLISLFNPSTLHDDNHRVTCLLTRPSTRTFCSLWPRGKSWCNLGQAYCAIITQTAQIMYCKCCIEWQNYQAEPNEACQEILFRICFASVALGPHLKIHTCTIRILSSLFTLFAKCCLASWKGELKATASKASNASNILRKLSNSSAEAIRQLQTTDLLDLFASPANRDIRQWDQELLT